MKIAITSQGNSLESPFDARFGRAMYFIIYDTDSGNFEAIQNPAVNATGGAGIQAAQIVASKGVQTVISGDFGPNAAGALSQAGIRMVPMQISTVKEAIEILKNNPEQFSEGNIAGAGSGNPPITPDNRDYGANQFGMYNFAPGFPPPFAPYTYQGPPGFWEMPKEIEINMLKNSQAFLKWQLELVEKRLKELEGE